MRRRMQVLTPDVVLNALDSAGLHTSGSLLALNSYENRVFQAGVETADGGSGFVVAKFYRPGRWSDAQILEEHAFIAELAAAEVPAVPPHSLDGRTLSTFSGFRFAVFPRRGGRAPLLDVPRCWCGSDASSAACTPSAARARSRASGARPCQLRCRTTYLSAGARLAAARVVATSTRAYRSRRSTALPVPSSAPAISPRSACHGDVHEGNVLWYDGLTDRGPHFVDFDDARMGPAVAGPVDDAGRRPRRADTAARRPAGGL